MTPLESVKAVRERMQLERRKDRLLLFCPLLFIYDEIWLRIFAGQSVFAGFLYPLLFAAASGVFVWALQCLLKEKPARILTLILLALVTALFTVESVIHSVYTTYMAPSDLAYAAGGVAAHYGSELVRSILLGIPKCLIFALPIALFVRHGRDWKAEQKLSLKPSAAIAALALILIGVISLFASHGRTAAIYGSSYSYDRATESLGLLTSTRLSAQYRIFGNANVSFAETETEPVDKEPLPDEAAESTAPEAEAFTPEPQVMPIDFSPVTNTGDPTLDNLTAYITSQTPSMTNAYTGLFEGKNLILICAESYCSAFISPELTPTLWRLTHNGIYCPGYYQPEWGGSTTTGEASFLVGLAPKGGDQTMLELKDNNNYFTLGNQLQRLGYSSCAFHSGAITYYHRDETHENLGYDQFIANENGLTALCGIEYAHDFTVFDKTMDLYLDKQPFSIYYMTISGHAPYTKDSVYVDLYYDQVDQCVGASYKEKTKYYICYQMELEYALTEMVTRLEEKGIADDTVIALVGDHYPYGLGRGEAWKNDENYINDLIRGDSKVSFLEDKNDLILWSGCLETEKKEMACTLHTPVSSLDIVPTLTNLFGLPYDSRLLPGRDIFSIAEPLVFWNDLSWVTTEGRYDAKHEKYYPNDLNLDLGEPLGAPSGSDAVGVFSDDPAYAEYRARIDALVQNKLLMSRAIVDTDYYGRLFGPDDVTQAGETVFVLPEAG